MRRLDPTFHCGKCGRVRVGAGSDRFCGAARPFRCLACSSSSCVLHLRAFAQQPLGLEGESTGLRFSALHANFQRSLALCSRGPCPGLSFTVFALLLLAQSGQLRLRFRARCGLHGRPLGFSRCCALCCGHALSFRRLPLPAMPTCRRAL